ncbi:probable cytosolic iron-sulfur protein assembly protein CI [Coccomyxa sp. Obi]|nr:probable cytosolic iron-sulfur protein assembly protein CI [Coccomyxa sp. Obi]
MGELTHIQTLEGHTDRAWHVAWSPTGETLASCSGDKTVRLWTRRQPGSEEWMCSATLEEAQTRTIRCCSWSPDGRSLATASFDATTAIWEVQAGVWEQVALLEGHENEVKGVAWSPSGSLIATCSRDKSVWIWEALPGNEYECVDVKQGHTQDVKAVAWHPKGEILVSCSYDDTIKLWRESDDEWICEQTLSGPGIGHTSTVWGVAFEASGERMVSCSDDCTLHVWSCTSKNGEPWWRLLTTVSGCHERTIFSVDWSRSGAIASGSGDNSICVHEEEPTTSADIDPLQKPSFSMAAKQSEAHPADVNCVRWNPQDPTLLASAGDDGSIRLWRYRRSPDDQHVLNSSHNGMTTMPET